LNLCHKKQKNTKKAPKKIPYVYISITHCTLLPRIGFEFKFHVFFVSVFMKWKWKPSSWTRSSYMKSLGWNTFHPRKIINLFISSIKCSSSTNWFFGNNVIRIPWMKLDEIYLIFDISMDDWMNFCWWIWGKKIMDENLNFCGIKFIHTESWLWEGTSLCLGTYVGVMVMSDWG